MRKTKEDARLHAMADLKHLQDELRDTWLDRSLPEGWAGTLGDAHEKAPKTRVTIRLDADMVKWFRAQGPGYQGRINRVLRIYWNAVISGLVNAHYDEQSVTPTFMQMVIERARLSAGNEDEDDAS